MESSAEKLTGHRPVATGLKTPTLRLLGGFVFDVFDDVPDRLGVFLRVFVRYFDSKVLFKGHYQFNDIQRVCAQNSSMKDGLRRDLLRVHAKLLDDNVLDLVFDRFFPP